MKKCVKKRIKIGQILVLSAILGVNSLFGDSIFFMPYQAEAGLKALIKELDSAKSEVKISIYSFTNKEIAKAIKKSAKSGVKYSIIFDEKSNVKNNFSQIGNLAKLKNISVCTLQGFRAKSEKYNGIMHHKLAVIDNKVIIFGSANWSKAAFESNHELLVISNNKEYIDSANEFFSKMLSECKPY